jgi:cobalt/nickel transport system permease protein
MDIMHHLTRQTDHGENRLTRLDARVKLLTVLVLLAMVISCRGFAFPLGVVLICLSGCCAIGVRLRMLAVRFAEPLFIAVMVILLKLLFSGRTPLFSLDIFGLEIVGHREGLREGLLIAARIAGSVSLVAFLGFSTTFTGLMAALAWFRVPKGFIDVALFAWRYLFVLLDDAQVVYSAQRNRLGYAGFRRGLRSFGALAGALVIKAFDKSQTITTAMVQRGYDGDMPHLKHKPFRAGEVTASLTFLICMVLIWRF